MSAENVEPGLRLSIEALRFDGDGFAATGEGAAGIDLHGTDHGEQAEVLRLLRSIAAGRARYMSSTVAVLLDQLDFDAPNHPTEDDIEAILAPAERLLGALRALKHLAPETLADDEEGGDA